MYTLFVYRDGLPWKAVLLPASGDNFAYRFTGGGPARYRLQIQRFVEGVAAIGRRSPLLAAATLGVWLSARIDPVDAAGLCDEIAAEVESWR